MEPATGSTVGRLKFKIGRYGRRLASCQDLSADVTINQSAQCFIERFSLECCTSDLFQTVEIRLQFSAF